MSRRKFRVVVGLILALTANAQSVAQPVVVHVVVMHHGCEAKMQAVR